MEDAFGMGLERLEASTANQIPNTQSLIPPTRNCSSPVGREANTTDPSAVASEDLDALAKVQIPDPKRIIVAP